ncbi:MAG: trypsin-like peptidase domain-containing protein [Bdellovibrionaceae bacterium]|nr:trypsin-like peptidase domain-containing protein [Bdellovibrionales bacterium]MCB9083418.1 trypsin-like peptidase domain-containing protein [Pseudobdellovibrionaceae bacterium]
MLFSVLTSRAILFLGIMISSQLAFAEVGFLKTLPEFPQVEAAKESVFKIFAPRTHEFRLFENPSATIEEVSKMTGVDEHEKAVIVSQLRGCLELKLEPCIIDATYVRGTAFVLERDNVLATVFHNVDFHLVTIRKYFAKFSRPINVSIEKTMYGKMNHPFALVNSKGEVVWGQLADQKTIKMVMNWKVLDQKHLDNDLKSEDDWALFQLSHPIGKPLKLAASLPAIGEKVFVAGFPAETQGREKFGKANSDGESFFMTVGQVLDPSAVDGRLYGAPAVGVGFSGGMMPGPRSIMGGMFSQMRGCSSNESCLYTTNDGKYGFSGSPFLNAQGEVVGVATTGLPAEDEEVTPDSSTFWGVPVQTLRAALEELLAPAE